MGGRSLRIAAREHSAGGGGDSGDGGCGIGPGVMAGADIYHTYGSTGGVAAAACQVAPPRAVCGGATSSVRGYAHVTSGENHPYALQSILPQAGAGKNHPYACH